MPFLTALFDLHGTATRKQALRVFLVMLAALAATVLVERVAPDYGRFVVPLAGLVQVWWAATAVRRLHDAGHSGLWALVLIVPVLGLVASVVILALRADRPFNDGNAGLQLAGALCLVTLAFLSFSRFFWAPYWVPSEAMKPTLAVGDYLVVRHLKPEALQRGDVVVFRHPVTGQEQVNRLIGLPGDVIAVQRGLLVLNGATVPQEEAGLLREPYGPEGPLGSLPRCFNVVVGVGGICEKQLWIETLPEGAGYQIANIEDGAFADDIGPFTVPDGQMFLMGDNRDNSADSRFAQGAGGLGFVPQENVIGRVTGILFSSAGTSLWAVWDWRADRILRSLE